MNKLYLPRIGFSKKTVCAFVMFFSASLCMATDAGDAIAFFVQSSTNKDLAKKISLQFFDSVKDGTNQTLIDKAKGAIKTAFDGLSGADLSKATKAFRAQRMADGGDSQAVMQLAGDLAAKINAAKGNKAKLAEIVQEDLFGEAPGSKHVGREVFMTLFKGGGALANSVMIAEVAA